MTAKLVLFILSQHSSMGGHDPPTQKTTSELIEKLDQRVKPADGEGRCDG